MVHRFNFLIYPNVQPMDVIGPWEVIATWKTLYPEAVEMQMVAEQAGSIACYNNISLLSHIDYSHAQPADYLIIPGGMGRLQQMQNPVFINFIQEQAKHCKKIISICTGTFLLAAAGLLKNKKVTTFWRALPELAQYKEIKICEERIVKDGNIWSSGGISSGIDLAFALIEEIAGLETAGEVQLGFEYFPSHKIYARRHQAEQLPTYPTLDKDTPIMLADYIAKKLPD